MLLLCFLFHGLSLFANVVQLMSKLSKRKSAQARITVMSWTKFFFQICLQRNGRIFEGSILLSWHVAKNVIFYVASRLDDDKKANLTFKYVSLISLL